MERLQLLESGSSDVSFMSHDVSQWLVYTCPASYSNPTVFLALIIFSANLAPLKNW